MIGTAGSRERPRPPGTRIPALLLPALLAAAAPVAADIYRLIDEQGVIHLSDKPAGDDWKLIVRTRKAWSPDRVRPMPENRARFWPLVDAAARRHGLNQALIDAVITAESGYNPDALSSAGAMGLMQLMPDTARAFGVADPNDPAQNIEGATRYLRRLMDRYLNLELALAAYNAGETAVARFDNQVPPYPETRHYVRKVMGLFRQGLERQAARKVAEGG
ncbi:MAG: lytic transglycosylase domain-containing protein [Gammaproteobacteria bacterium]|nr:lytic transglycosylase domain-containing protein [Gammaproteobacteria bacterium]